jgi:outer membrane protein OmpA-like peptidoglycan-associated protein
MKIASVASYPLGALGLVLLAACSPPQIAGKPLAPTTTQDAFKGTSCSAVRPQTEPDLMAWDPQSRGLLSVLHRREVVVVRYAANGCNVELELLSNCHAKGAYEFAPYASRSFKLAHNENELFAQLPIGALDIAANLSGDRAIRTDFMFVGIDSLPDDATFRSTDLAGIDCPRATHVVNRVYLGGFAMAAGESRTLDATSTFLGTQAGAKSAASIRQLDSEGNVEDCETAQRDGKPNGGCQTPLRIGLLPIERPIPGARSTDTSTPPETSPRAGVSAPTRAMSGEARELPAGLLQFDAGAVSPRDDEANVELLNRIAEFMRQNPSVSVLRIEGHTSSVGSPEKNQILSERRAAAIKDALVARGIEARRLETVGFGPTMPIADNNDAVGRAKNNRVEVRIAP